MRISLVLPGERHCETAHLVELAQTAEDLGYHGVWLPDHIVIPTRYESRYPYNRRGQLDMDPDGSFPECVVTMAYLAGCTKRVRIGSAVLVLSLRNPVLTSQQLATLHFLSRGRLVVGIGVGWLKEEFEVLGVNFHERARMTDEYIDAMRCLWTPGEASFAGRYVKFEGVLAYPKPWDDVPPRVYIGGNTPSARRRAATRGDGWFPAGLPRAELQQGIADLKQAAREAGRDSDHLEMLASSAISFGAGPSQRSFAERRTLRGEPEDVVRDLAWFAEQGVDEVVLFPLVGREAGWFDQYLSIVRRVGEECMPKMQVKRAS